MVLPVGGGEAQPQAGFNPAATPWYLLPANQRSKVGLLSHPVGVAAPQVGVQGVVNPQVQGSPGAPQFAPGQGLPALPVPTRPMPEPPPDTPFQGNETIMPAGLGMRRRLIGNYKTDEKGNRTPFSQEIIEAGKAPAGDYGPISRMTDPRQFHEDFMKQRIGVLGPRPGVGVPLDGASMTGSATAMGSRSVAGQAGQEQQANAAFEKLLGFVSPSDKVQQEKLSQIGEKNKGEAEVAKITAQGHVDAAKANREAMEEATVQKIVAEAELSGEPMTAGEIAGARERIKMAGGKGVPAPTGQAPAPGQLPVGVPPLPTPGVPVKPGEEHPEGRHAAHERLHQAIMATLGTTAVPTQQQIGRTGKTVPLATGGDYASNRFFETMLKSPQVRDTQMKEYTEAIMNNPKAHPGLPKLTEDMETGAIMRLNASGAFDKDAMTVEGPGGTWKQITLPGGIKIRQQQEGSSTFGGFMGGLGTGLGFGTGIRRLGGPMGLAPTTKYQIETPHGTISNLDTSGAQREWDRSMQPYQTNAMQKNWRAEAEAISPLITELHGRTVGRRLPPGHQAPGAGEAIGNMLIQALGQ